MINRSMMVQDDLATMTFLGVVVDTADPLHIGRCRIRVYGKFDEIADGDLPWATPLLGLSFAGSGAGGALSVPRVDAVVRVTFNSGNIYAPEYSAVQEVSQGLRSEISGSYTNAQSVVWDDDEQLSVYYTQQKGFTIVLKGSSINIANDNTITITHKDTKSIIEMRGNNITVTADSEINVTAGSRCKIEAPEVWLNAKETKLGHVPAYSAVLAEPLFAFLKVLSAAVDSKLYPTPSAMADACETAEQLSTSTTVMVSKDNGNTNSIA